MRRVIIWLLIAITVVTASAYTYIFHLGGLEDILNRQIDELLESRYNIEVDIGRVSGDFFSEVVIEDITITYGDSLTTYRLASIPRISAKYAFSNLINSNYHLDYLHIDSAEFTVVQDTVRGWLLPGGTASGESVASPPPPFSVGTLRLSEAAIHVVRGEQTLSFTGLGLSLAMQGDQETYSVDVENLRYRCSDERLSLNAAGGKVTYAQKRLMFADLALSSASTRIRLDGAIMFDDEPDGHLEFDIDNIDLGAISAYLGPKLKGVLDLNGGLEFRGGAIQGTVDIGGTLQFASFENLFLDFRYQDKRLYLDTLYGTILGSCAIDGNGEIDFSIKPERYRLAADINNFNLYNLLHKGFESDLSGRIEVRGESFRKETLRLDVSTRLYESSFHDFPIHSGAGDMIITIDSIQFADSFRVDYFENVFLASGTVVYSDSLYLNVEADLANLDRYRGKLFIDQPGGRGKARAVLSGRTSDPDLRGTFVSDSLWLYGLFSDSAEVTGDIARFLTAKQGTVRVSCFHGAAWSLPFDSLGSRLTIDSNLVRIDSLGLRNAQSFIAGQALLDYEASPMLLTVDSMYISAFDREFYNRRDLIVNIDSSGFYFDQVNIGNNRSRILAVGRANYDESLDLILSVAEVPVAPWIHLFEQDLDIGGRVSCEAAVKGSLDEPIINLLGRVDSLSYEGLELGELRVALDYRDRHLILDSVCVYSDPGAYRATGFMAVDLALTADSLDRFPDSPMDIHITAEDSRFDLVSLVMPSVEELEGDFTADFRLSGTPDRPQLAGGAKLIGGKLKYFDLVHPMYTDSAGVTMRNDKILIDRVVAYVMDDDEPVYAYLSGELTVKSLDNIHYNLNVDIPEPLPFSYELEDITGRASGTMHIEGDSPPLVTGDIQLVSMKYRVPFAEVNEGSPIMAALTSENSWDLNLNIEILSNYWIQNEDIDAEFAGEINLIRQAGLYRFIGEMNVLRGKGFLFDKTFRLDADSRVIFEGEDNLNARLDITGQSRFTGYGRSALDTEDNSSEQITVCVHVTGTVDLPEIDPTPCEGEADESITREELLPLLLTNSFSSSGVTASSRFEQGLGGVLGSQISQIGTRRLSRLGVETFELDPYYGGEFDPLNARVTVGFYTAPGLYVYGRSALSLQTGQEVGFEYRFSRNFLLEGRGDEDLYYSLSAKLNWDF